MKPTDRESVAIRGRPTEPLLTRFWRYVEKRPDGCWYWRGAIDVRGYARFEYPNGDRASRFSYETFKHPIPPGLTIDHLCRNRACVNPDHLEAVTQRENVLRGIDITAQNAKAEKCPRGHSYDAGNTIISKGHRYCRECNRVKMTVYNLRRVKNAT